MYVRFAEHQRIGSRLFAGIAEIGEIFRVLGQFVEFEAEENGVLAEGHDGRDVVGTRTVLIDRPIGIARFQRAEVGQVDGFRRQEVVVIQKIDGARFIAEGEIFERFVRLKDATRIVDCVLYAVAAGERVARKPVNIPVKIDGDVRGGCREGMRERARGTVIHKFGRGVPIHRVVVEEYVQIAVNIRRQCFGARAVRLGACGGTGKVVGVHPIEGQIFRDDEIIPVPRGGDARDVAVEARQRLPHRVSVEVIDAHRGGVGDEYRIPVRGEKGRGKGTGERTESAVGIIVELQAVFVGGNQILSRDDALARRKQTVVAR